MDAGLRAMLNESEQELLRATEPRELKRLGEDDLAALHDRIRRARAKYNKLYRRRAAQQVSADGSRTRAHAANAKAARKAEGFEDALARVSHRLAQVAAVAAAELKAERLAAASRPTRTAAPTRRPGDRRNTGSSRSATAARTPASEKQRAGTKASNKRNQAARDRRS